MLLSLPFSTQNLSNRKDLSDLKLSGYKKKITHPLPKLAGLQEKKNDKQTIQTIFPIHTMDNSAIYLGRHLIISHSDITKAYNFILTKFKSKLPLFKANKLNHAG